MNKSVALSIFTILLWLFSFDAKSANSMVNCRTETAQVAFDRSELSIRGKNKHKLGRRPLKQKTKALLENVPTLSFGGAALMLLLSCLIVLLIMPALAALSLAFYVTSLFFAAIGLGRDKNKVPAIITLVLAILPILLLVAFVIECRIHGCFD